MKKIESAPTGALRMVRLVVLVLGLLPLPAFAAVSLTSPNNNALYLAPAAAIPVKANASVSGATIVQMEFYANGNLIGTDATSPYQFDWTNVAAGTYVITAKSIDSNSVETTSSPRTINVAANNTAPTVSLTAPANNASYISPSNVSASATASGPELNDLLQRVEFYLNGNLAATVTSAPYTTSLSGLADGTYSLTAVAVDGQGAQTTSAARSFSIGQNQPPTVSITTPLDNSKWHAPAGFMFQVSAAAPETNDTLTVEFYANGNLIGTRSSAPWSINTSNLTAGTYVLTAKAIDGQGANTTSNPRTIVVSDTNNNPTVSITAPAASSNFAAPAPSITVSATANAGEVNGWITRVEFYVNGVLTNTDTAGPFSFNWTNVPAGSYAITAKAVDQLNGETTSAAVNVTVGAASIHFIHTDHLNTPRLITNNVGQAVWTWNNDDPFGANVPNENPSSLGDFTCNLRLPGQYFDKETNTHYNMARDYDAVIGRYIQSDPIGLEGGLNTYGYAAASPLGFIDPDGLKVTLICRPVQGPIGLLYDHCFVHVTCPSEGINKTLSLFGSFPYFGGGARKSVATPDTYKKNPAYPDNPSKKNPYTVDIEACNNSCCEYEKAVLARFSDYIGDSYEGLRYNSNNFARYLISDPRFCASVPSDAPRRAPGIQP
jgi:RHS repeat-associated protein